MDKYRFIISHQLYITNPLFVTFFLHFMLNIKGHNGSIVQCIFALNQLNAVVVHSGFEAISQHPPTFQTVIPRKVKSLLK